MHRLHNHTTTNYVPLGKFKDECGDKELLGFTSLGPKNYDISMGHIINEFNAEEFQPVVTEVNVRCKGLNLTRQDSKGLITKDLMREFLYSLAKKEDRELNVVQHRFEILRNSFKIRPIDYIKKYNNQNLFQKRVFNTNVSLTQTYPIGAVEYYK